jgi:hypothetical protein
VTSGFGTSSIGSGATGAFGSSAFESPSGNKAGSEPRSAILLGDTCLLTEPSALDPLLFSKLQKRKRATNLVPRGQQRRLIALGAGFSAGELDTQTKLVDPGIAGRISSSAFIICYVNLLEEDNGYGASTHSEERAEGKEEMDRVE